MLLDGDLTVDAGSEGPRMKAALSYEGSQAAANPSGERAVDGSFFPENRLVQLSSLNCSSL